MRVEENYKRTGFFWLPEKEDRKIPGILSIDDGGRVELEVVGHFDEDFAAMSHDNDFLRIIGHVEKDGYVTLDKCIYSLRNFAFGGISKSRIVVNKLLSGAAWDKDESLTFNTFSFSVDCLDEWVGISGISVDTNWENRTATVNYQPPETISIVLDNGMTLGVCFAYTLPGSKNLTEAKITQRAYFKLESKAVCDLNDFISIAFKITNLLCFAMDEIVSIKNVSATSSEITREIGDKKTIPVVISIYYQSIPFVEKAPKKNRHEMLFNFGVIKNNFQKVINNWISAYEKLTPALSLYFSTKAGAQRYIDGKFLALAQGLETYHRRTSSETLMDKDLYDSLVLKIIEGCPEDNVDWLKGRLMNGNEINLSKRLKKIIDPFKEHIGTFKERNKLLRKIVDTRNYLTHYNENLRDEAATGKELWILCLKMEVIFSLHYLRVIGFSDAEITGVVKNSQPLQRKLKGL